MILICILYIFLLPVKFAIIGRNINKLKFKYPKPALLKKYYYFNYNTNAIDKKQSHNFLCERTKSEQNFKTKHVFANMPRSKFCSIYLKLKNNQLNNTLLTTQIQNSSTTIYNDGENQNEKNNANFLFREWLLFHYEEAFRFTRENSAVKINNLSYFSFYHKDKINKYKERTSFDVFTIKLVTDLMNIKDNNLLLDKSRKEFNAADSEKLCKLITELFNDYQAFNIKIYENNKRCIYDAKELQKKIYYTIIDFVKFCNANFIVWEQNILNNEFLNILSVANAFLASPNEIKDINETQQKTIVIRFEIWRKLIFFAKFLNLIINDLNVVKEN